MNLLDIFLKGGFMMYPILICSLIGCYVIVTQLLKMRNISTDTANFLKKIDEYIEKGNIEASIEICRLHKGPIAAILSEGLKRADKDMETIKEAIQNSGKEQIYYLEKDLGILATIASVAPLFGFLGTVTGMIQAFYQIQIRGGNVDASVLAGGIWEAMITTAAGLAVGIPILLFYNYFVGKVEWVVFEMERSSNLILESLEEKRGVK